MAASSAWDGYVETWPASPAHEPAEAEPVMPLAPTWQAAHRGWWTALRLLLGLGIMAALAWGYQATVLPVTVRVDGLEATIRTHQATVGDLLAAIELPLAAQDRLWPAASTPLEAGMTIEVRRARPLLLESVTSAPQPWPEQSRLRRLWTQASTLGQALAEAGITLGPADEVSLEGRPGWLDTPFPPAQVIELESSAGPRRLYPWEGMGLQPVRVTVHRALPLHVTEDGFSYTIWTTASTIGEALAREGLVLYAGDQVRPGLGEPVSAGLHVWVEHSRPVTVKTAGRTYHTRTRRQTVAGLLAEQGILLAGEDQVEPPLSTPISDGMVIQITHKEHAFEVEEEITPFATVWEPDPEMEIDTRRLDQEGAVGIVRRRYRLILENGQPITRTLEDTWLAQQPVTRVIKYGTKIVLREVQTPEGPLTYWRKVRMFATSYTASDAGTPRDAPYFGYTRLGWKMRHGIVAVDPTVVKMGTKVYVPGYGLGDVADTGSAIKGRWIDLGYEDGAMVPWSRCVDVYLLAPPPPAYQIDYLLPSYPNVPCLRR